MLLRTLYQILIFISCMSACTSNNHYNNYTFDTYVNAPEGSYVKAVTTPNHYDLGYKIYLEENTGKYRSEIETAMISLPSSGFKSLSFQLFGNHKLEKLKTPITLIEVIEPNKNKVYASIKLQNNIYWLEYQNKYEKLPIFPDHQKETISFLNTPVGLVLRIQDKNYTIHNRLSESMIYIGLKRTDLMRYKGQLVPEQSLIIDNITIEPYEN